MILWWLAFSKPKLHIVYNLGLFSASGGYAPHWPIGAGGKGEEEEEEEEEEMRFLAKIIPDQENLIMC